jgi:hypothetical protein
MFGLIAAGLDATAHCDNLSKGKTEAMETFYILLFSYSIQGHPIERTLLLENSEQCQIAIRANEPIATAMGIDLYCIDTGRISKSIRPKLRPSTQSEGRQETDVCLEIDANQCKRS